jgi:hypothetical protein
MTFILLHFLLPLLNLFSGQDMWLCNQPNNAYSTGEKIRYTIYYNVLGLYVNAGSADFTIQSTNWNEEDAYKFTATGRSNGKYDWIFKVRDKYESRYQNITALSIYKTN